MFTASEVPHRLSDNALKDFFASMVSPDCRCAEALTNSLEFSISLLENAVLNATVGHHEAYFHRFYDDLEVLLTICMTISIRVSGLIVIESLLFVWTPDNPPPANQQLTLKERKNKNSLSVSLYKFDRVCNHSQRLVNTVGIDFLSVLSTFLDNIGGVKSADNIDTTSEYEMQHTPADGFNMIRLPLARAERVVACSKAGDMTACERSITVSGFTSDVNYSMFPDPVSVKDLESSSGLYLAWKYSPIFNDILLNYSSVISCTTASAHFGLHTDFDFKRSGVIYPIISWMVEKDSSCSASIDGVFMSVLVSPGPKLLRRCDSLDDCDFPRDDSMVSKNSFWNHSSETRDSTPSINFGLHNELNSEDIKYFSPSWLVQTLNKKHVMGTGFVSSYGSCY